MVVLGRCPILTNRKGARAFVTGCDVDLTPNNQYISCFHQCHACLHVGVFLLVLRLRDVLSNRRLCPFSTSSRCVREQCGLDLSPCRRWLRMVEVHYARPAETRHGIAVPEHNEITVIYIPDVWTALPNPEQV